ncbi:MAG TPA: hypothetical protein VLF14_03555 [Candidatus Binatia bacterium]|nr:hypothetical protein [Candidatus Binatia bacterium]
MLRIETALETAADVLLRLTGKISEEHLVMLDRLVDEALESGRRVGLDLGAVTLADREAVELLALHASRGVVFERCPAFLREWIRGETEQRARRRPAVFSGSLPPRATTGHA